MDVDLSGLTIVIPRVFGGRGRWFIPVREVGVVLPPRPADSPHQFSAEEEPWVTRDEFQVPYLSTTSPLAPPNLLLLFTVPQEVPPIRWTASQDLGLSRRANRAGEGVTVDGVGLRVVGPAVARRVLLAVGAQAVTDVDAFVDRHRDVVRGPEEVRSAVTTERRTRIVSVCVWVVMVTCFTASAVTDDDRYGLVLIAVVLAGGVVRWLTRRSRRS